jgi:hypothetical protein
MQNILLKDLLQVLTTMSIITVVKNNENFYFGSPMVALETYTQDDPGKLLDTEVVSISSKNPDNIIINVEDAIEDYAI